MTIPFLIETALLTHGLPGLTAADIRTAWPEGPFFLCWLDHGAVTVGSLNDFLSFRDTAGAIARVSAPGLDEAESKGYSAALTASATLTVAVRFGAPVAVSGGIGGLRSVRAEGCRDLSALTRTGLTLIATAPKDMFSPAATVACFESAGVHVSAVGASHCDGYLFRCHPETCSVRPFSSFRRPDLILQPIPERERLNDRLLLREAIDFGLQQEAAGHAFHPAVNRFLADRTAGQTSRLQLRSLVRNIMLAQSLTDGSKG